MTPCITYSMLSLLEINKELFLCKIGQTLHKTIIYPFQYRIVIHPCKVKSRSLYYCFFCEWYVGILAISHVSLLFPTTEQNVVQMRAANYQWCIVASSVI